ncbi:hypothetical protein BU23DRAFT_571345 [Bimuria novae-zelandiae CBS 107.79]|uniref:Uncharacterized protein n=1 Tax=Bimuria novae-zelandiae CBS 107.79 TaxID=1447943 RepID=A0A6A5V3L2_9PLEO|nr:hypothetical protein BU23DRAFT_571345 [Bimuria novae-zelandiae CBS 107.79]
MKNAKANKSYKEIFGAASSQRKNKSATISGQGKDKRAVTSDQDKNKRAGAVTAARDERLTTDRDNPLGKSRAAVNKFITSLQSVQEADLKLVRKERIKYTIPKHKRNGKVHHKKQSTVLTDRSMFHDGRSRNMDRQSADEDRPQVLSSSSKQVDNHLKPFDPPRGPRSDSFSPQVSVASSKQIDKPFDPPRGPRANGFSRPQVLAPSPAGIRKDSRPSPRRDPQGHAPRRPHRHNFVPSAKPRVVADRRRDYLW